jgi:hypothetical protein
MTLKVIIVGGYARAGKTTAIRLLSERLLCPVFSTSDLLHKTRHNLQAAFPELPQKLDTEGNRQLNIKIAEDVLIPIYGRRLFAHTVASDALKYYRELKTDRDVYVVTESIGGEEYVEMTNFFLEEYRKGCKLRLYPINIRSLYEQPGIDKRELIPTFVEVQNTGTIDDLRAQLNQTLGI